MQLVSHWWLVLYTIGKQSITVCLLLITCVIGRSNPSSLFSFYRSGNVGHYQSTMTSHNDPHTWCHERQMRLLLKHQTRVRATPCTRAFTIFCNDCHAWTDQNFLTGIGRQFLGHCVNWLVIILTPVFFFGSYASSEVMRGLGYKFWCHFCVFSVRYCLLATLLSILVDVDQKNTSVQHNHFWFHTMTSKKDGAQLLLSKSCTRSGYEMNTC